MENDEWVVLYAADQEAELQQVVLPLLTDRTVLPVVWDTEQPPELSAGSKLLVWLGDGALSELIPLAATQGWKLALLPHPEMSQAQRGLNLPTRMTEALQQMDLEGEGTPVDLLFCNNRPVFNAVSVGDPFGLLSFRQGETFQGRWQRFIRLVMSLGEVRLRAFTLTTEKGKTLETAALGMVAVARGDASPFTRRVVEEEDDHKLNLLILSPRSVMEALRYLFVSMLPFFTAHSRLPDFLGRIKSRTVTINAPQPVTCIVDGHRFKSDCIELREEKAQLILLNTGMSVAVSENTSPKEVFRVQGLPSGEARRELLAYPLPWIHHAATEEFKDLFLILKDNARASESYLTLMVLSTLLAITGLFSNSAPVIIGAMILAPLMAPIISLSMGVLRQHEQLVMESGRSLLLGVGLALLCATVMTWMTPLQTINDQIAARLSPTLLDLGVAIISGIAGAYAHARAEVAKSLAGVAIAVALVPPLAVAGIGIGWFDWAVFWGAFLLFLTNLAGIVLAASLTFLVLGFSPFKLARIGLGASLVVVVLISIPLMLSFSRMVDENRIIRQLEGQEVLGVRLQEVRVRPGTPAYISVKLLTDQPVTLVQVDAIKQELERQLGHPVLLEANVALLR
ncbi:MAG: TIGR00341 family protein [Marinospirillum sp.]|uniref:TIGR00341 family protein n=1 Tax=Marinospirillum sp. TaxID=2183934 RepID=UPI001A0DA387|nr:TIGR00341 family protein [Marinospirillum sp.]MBE0507825.1 TIGR00341 family protein [Marinospirillum sp.]